MAPLLPFPGIAPVREMTLCLYCWRKSTAGAPWPSNSWLGWLGRMLGRPLLLPPLPMMRISLYFLPDSAARPAPSRTTVGRRKTKMCIRDRPLQRAASDEPAQSRSHCAADRGQGEQQDATDQHPAIPVEIAHSSCHDDDGSHGEQVGQHDPLHLLDAGRKHACHAG